MPSVEQQIEQSRAKKKALIKKSLLGFSLVMLIGVAGVLLISYMPTVTSNVTDATDDTTAVPQTAKSTPVVEVNEEERKALQMALSELKQSVNDLVSRVSHSQMFLEKASEVERKLNTAFNEYGASNYGAVMNALDDIKSSVNTINTDYENAYTQPYEDALLAFNNGNISSAFNLNKTSLTINPDFEKANILQQRIDVFDEVQDAYEQARIGKVENNISKQREAYAKIVQLDPARKDAQQALDAINRQLQDSRFDTLLAQANRAIEQGDYPAAAEFLNDAKSLKASSTELATISKKLASLVASQEQQKIENQVALFVSADEWQTVKLLANKGLASFPASPALLEAKQNAEAILDAEKSLSAYQRRPERLSDNNVRNLALKDIARAGSHAEKSAKLRAQISSLEQVIDNINQPRSVTITSDNDTYIKVLGVGLVGEVKTKTIQLKPGTYRIEGSREGYRSTIQEIVVSPSDTNLSVHVVCTEKV